MANSDKNIIIRPRTGDGTNNPVLEFVGASSVLGPQTITFEATPDNQGTVIVKGTSGTILTIADNATYPLLVAKNTQFSGTVSFAGSLALDGNVTIGNATTDTLTINSTIQGATPLIFEGSTSDGFETSIAITDPTADRTITIPDNTGTVAVAGSSTSVQSELDISISATGVISGSAEGLATTDIPTFAGLTLNGSSIVFEGSTADLNETTLTVTDPTADRTITLPDNSGTVAVAGASTTTQSELDISISATGVISGSAEGLATTDTPTFAGLTINGTTITFEGSVSDTFETFLIATNATADRNITLPDASGTVAVSVSDTTTTTQGALNLDFTLSSLGNISATGTAQGLSTTGTPTFNTLTTTTTLTVGTDLVPDTDNTGNVGTSALTFAGGWFTNLTVDSTLDVRGAIDLADSDILRFGTGDDWEFFHDGTNNYIDLNLGDLLIRDNTTTRFTFARTTGDFTATGAVTVGTDLVPDTDNTGNVGTTALTWNNGVFTNLTVDSTLDVRGAIDLADSDILRFGTGDDMEIYHNATDNIIDLTVGDLLIRDDATVGDPTRFTFARATGNFTASGDVTAFSDERLKTDISTFSNALNTVCQMRGVSFTKDGRKGVGVIAQEMEAVLPEVVNNDSEYKSVAYGNIVGVLIEAIKELKAEIEELKKSKN